MATQSPTDRYVWAVLRSVPTKQRPELEREVRALIADATEAKAADGTLDAAAAERAALEELGSPDALATGYTGQANHLIGPSVYPAWKGLLSVLLSIVVPIVGFAVLGANLIGGSTVGQAVVAGLGTAFMAAVQMLFWVTLIFALIERFGDADTRAELDETVASIGAKTPGIPRHGRWTVADLPEIPDDARITVGELAGSLITNVLLLGFLLWIVPGSPQIPVDGESIALFDPALWSFWLPWFIAITVIEIVFTVLVFRRGRWTYAAATINALLGAAFVLPALYLLANDLLFNPAIVEAVSEATSGGSWIQPTKVVTGVVIIAVVAWDAAEAFLRARRATEQDRSVGSLTA
jgi:hypothetical protein